MSNQCTDSNKQAAMESDATRVNQYELKPLYWVSSTIEEFRARVRVPVHCFGEHRDTPLIPYETGIEGYADADSDTQAAMAKEFDRMFSVEEVEKLRRFFLGVHGAEITVQEQPLPLVFDGLIWDDYFYQCLEYPDDLLCLDVPEEYGLTIPISALTRVEDCEFSESRIHFELVSYDLEAAEGFCTALEHLSKGIMLGEAQGSDGLQQAKEELDAAREKLADVRSGFCGKWRLLKDYLSYLKARPQGFQRVEGTSNPA